MCFISLRLFSDMLLLELSRDRVRGEVRSARWCRGRRWPRLLPANCRQIARVLRAGSRGTGVRCSNKLMKGRRSNSDKRTIAVCCSNARVTRPLRRLHLDGAFGVQTLHPSRCNRLWSDFLRFKFRLSELTNLPVPFMGQVRKTACVKGLDSRQTF